MKNKKLIIKEFSFIVLVLIIYFEPQAFKETYYSYLLNVDKVYKILKLIGFVILSIFYIKHKKISKLFLVMLLFQTIGLCSTIINDGDIVRFSGPALTTLVMIMSAEILISYNKLFECIKICLIYFRICFVINIISIFLIDFVIPYSIPLYFLGIDNRFIFTYLPWITFEFLYAIHKYGKIDKKSFLMFILSEATLLYKFSLAAMLVSLLWLIVLRFDYKIVKQSIKFYWITLLLNYLVVIARIQNFFAPLLDSLEKNITLSGRTFLWDRIFNLIKIKPLLGNGMQNEISDRLFFSGGSLKSYLAVAHGHNSYLTVLFRTGIIGVIVYISIIHLVLKKLVKYFNNKYSIIFLISIFIALLLSLFDTIDCAGFYFILACSYSINAIDKAKYI